MELTVLIVLGQERKRNQYACIYILVHKKRKKKIRIAAIVLVIANEMIIKPQLMLIIYLFLTL